LQFKSMESLYFPALNNLFNQNGYRSSLESLANEFNLSLRQLNNHLNHEVGFPLSYFRRLHRFSKIIRHFKVSSIRSLTEVAYQFGYCDQAHFTREFKIMSTKTPRKYLKYIGQEKMLAPDLVDNFEFSNVMIDSCFNREK
ncbi:MAG: helix-turn-helix domain-containing protein, partial [Bacteroidota bacterium]